MPARSNYKTYTVVSGDSLSKIAARFGSSVQAIATASGVTDPNRISVGQELLIPVAVESDLSEVKVTAKMRPTSSPKSDPRSDMKPPIISLRDYIAPWFEPPRLYGTLVLLAAAGYYLLTMNPRRRK